MIISSSISSYYTVLWDRFEVFRLISGVNSCVDGIDSCTCTVGNVSKSTGIILLEYNKRVEKLGQVVGMYKRLIEKDMQEIKDVVYTFEGTDNEIGKKF